MPTSKGLSYSTCSLPRSACTIGAFSAAGELHHLVMRAGAAGAAQQRDALAAVQQLRQLVELAVAGGMHGRRRAGAAQLGARAALGRLQRHVAGITTTATPRSAIAVRIAISSTRGICSGCETSSQ